MSTKVGRKARPCWRRSDNPQRSRLQCRTKEWGECILLTEHRQALVPILVYCEGELDLLPDMPAAEKRRRQATAHAEIARAVVAARAICQRAIRTLRDTAVSLSPSPSLSRSTSLIRRIATFGLGISPRPRKGATVAAITCRIRT
jgi:hypothetical protein